MKRARGHGIPCIDQIAGGIEDHPSRKGQLEWHHVKECLTMFEDVTPRIIMKIALICLTTKEKEKKSPNIADLRIRRF